MITVASLFLDVRDTAGIVQIVVDPDVVTGTDVHRLRGEYVVRVEGQVRHRPDGTVNDAIPTGEVEVGVTALEVLSEAETPPFPIDDRIDADEVLRLRHRYLDLRRPRLQRNLRIRARERDAAQLARRAGVRRSRDADADRVHSGRRTRLRRSVAALAGLVLRVAAEPAAVQAAVDGRRPRSLLPDRPLPARRRPPRRSPVRVHAARRRDELRRRRRRHGGDRARGARRRRGGQRHAPGRGRHDDLAPGDGALRLRQARRALRPRAHGSRRGVRGHRVPRVPVAERQGHVPPR